jgi:hypothetical protein
MHSEATSAVVLSSSCQYRGRNHVVRSQTLTISIRVTIWQILSVTNEQDKICARIYATNEQIISPEKKPDERTLYPVR